MGTNINKLTHQFQDAYAVNKTHIYNDDIFKHIDPEVKIHDEAAGNALSSAAACLNVLGNLAQMPNDLLAYLQAMSIPVTKLYPFPTGANVGGEIYNDSGYVVFEWIGPKSSTINERGGKRGMNRTSVDAFILCEIDGKVTQLIIEWKFTEGNSRPLALNRFAGLKGMERIRRYSSVLAELRTKKDFPFAFSDEDGIGLHDFSPDHLLQLLRMTLLAKTTTPITIGTLQVEDYRIIHLSHSQNDDINILRDKYTTYSPGLKQFKEEKFHDVWNDLLSHNEKTKFIGAHWDLALGVIKDDKLRTYLQTRY